MRCSWRLDLKESWCHGGSRSLTLTFRNLTPLLTVQNMKLLRIYNKFRFYFYRRISKNKSDVNLEATSGVDVEISIVLNHSKNSNSNSQLLRERKKQDEKSGLQIFFSIFA